MSQPADAVNPSTLWHQANEEHPTDAAARTARYLDLMREQGHLIPRDELDDAPLLPCGYTPDDPVRVVARLLKRLYPENPDIVLGREARHIVNALSVAGYDIGKRVTETSG